MIQTSVGVPTVEEERKVKCLIPKILIAMVQEFIKSIVVPMVISIIVVGMAIGLVYLVISALTKMAEFLNSIVDNKEMLIIIPFIISVAGFICYYIYNIVKVVVETYREKKLEIIENAGFVKTNN